MTAEPAEGPEVDDALFAANLVDLRTTFGIGQAELARKLNDMGWSSVYQTTISRIEKGDRPVRIGEAKAIARALGVDLSRMTLSRAQNRLASKLAQAREALSRAEATIESGTRDWLAAHRNLQAQIQEALASGVEPSEILEQPEDNPLGGRTAVTLEDELADAIRASRRNPRLAVEMGEIADELGLGR